MVTSAGRFAAIGREPRQVRKEAAVAADSGAEVWLALVTTYLLESSFIFNLIRIVS